MNTSIRNPAGKKVICRNKQAFRDYFISDTYEAGLVLQGSEVKSLREGRANLSDAYIAVRGDELFMVGSHISEYPWANQFNHIPKRERKLLMHRQEIRRIKVKILERGFTLIPLQLYFLSGKAKVEIGLAKGKKQYDKRESVKERDVNRDVTAELSRRDKR